MYNRELIDEIGKNVVRRVGWCVFGLFEVYLLITVLIPLLISAKTIFKALLLITILVYGLCIFMTFCDALN